MSAIDSRSRNEQEEEERRKLETERVRQEVKPSKAKRATENIKSMLNKL